MLKCLDPDGYQGKNSLSFSAPGDAPRKGPRRGQKSLIWKQAAVYLDQESDQEALLYTQKTFACFYKPTMDVSRALDWVGITAVAQAETHARTSTRCKNFAEPLDIFVHILS